MKYGNSRRGRFGNRRFTDRMANLHSNLQARNRMRIPNVVVPQLHLAHVIRAITRHPEIDKEDLYGQALQGLRDGNNANAFSDFGEIVHRVTSGALSADKFDRLRRELFNRGLAEVDEHTCSRIREFDSKYLNNRGGSALLTLLTFDAGNLNPQAIDEWRGRDVLDPIYGPRKTRQAKELGEQIQILIKGLSSSDQPATIEAAYYYVEYRYLYDGNLSVYNRCRQLNADKTLHRSYRQWFRKFDKALGFPSPRSGRRATK